jgi:hypothetical protein
LFITWREAVLVGFLLFHALQHNIYAVKCQTVPSPSRPKRNGPYIPSAKARGLTGRYDNELCWLHSISVPISRKKPLWRNVLLSRRCVGVEEKERICYVVSYDGKHRLVITIWRLSFLPHLIDADKTPIAHFLWMRYTSS